MSEHEKKYARELQLQLLQYQQAYAVGKSPVSDAYYDTLLIQLKGLEAKYPELIHDFSPTQRIGPPVTSRNKMAHVPPMLSLDKVHTEMELASAFPDVDLMTEVVIEPKYDGLTLRLIYACGQLAVAALGGDGNEGEIVLENARTIKSVPLLIPSTEDCVEVRGEVYMLKSEFNQWASKVEQATGKRPANSRNSCAGAMRLLDPAECAQRPLRFVAYELLSQYDLDQDAKIKSLHLMGFDVGNRCYAALEQVLPAIRMMEGERENLDFDIDGVVIKINSSGLQAKLGTGALAPKWAVAWKFAPKAAQSTVTGIRIQVGRTGLITPVVDIEPVECAGVTISKATLHNMTQIGKYGGINVGASVCVQRAGDVIPDIVSIECAPDVPLWTMPANCPACDSPLEAEEEGTRIYCRNTFNCSAQIIELLQYHAKVLRIPYIGPERAQELVEEFKLKSLSDFYALDGRMREINSGGTPYLSRINMELPRQVPFARFLQSLGIPLIGEMTAKVVARHFGDWVELKDASQQLLQRLIGPAAAASLFNTLARPGAWEAFCKIAMKLDVQSHPKHSGPLVGATVVVTGTLQGYTRTSVKEAIESAGGTVGNSVTGATNYLVVGDNPGSKVQDAKKRGIRILNETEFNAILNASAD